MHNRAFTLAEVLITLTIVGVIASMTIPALVADSAKEQDLARIKKAYNVINQVMQRSIADNGALNTWTLGTTNYVLGEAETFADKYIVPYITTSKSCGNSTGCWADPVSSLGGASYTMDTMADGNKTAKYILVDGSSLQILPLPTDNLLFIRFDINGPKSPNIIGRDIFELRYDVVNNPYDPGAMSYYKSSSRTTFTTAPYPYRCLALIIRDGWVFADDYP